MAIYPVKNLKTGEMQSLNMTLAEYEDWRDNHPDWDKDWQAGCASAGEVGEWRDKMATTHPGWADIMKNKIVPQAKMKNNKTITEKYRY